MTLAMHLGYAVKCSKEFRGKAQRASVPYDPPFEEVLEGGIRCTAGAW